ncbi:MAG: YraN family protein [Janthinobacterium lividum]
MTRPRPLLALMERSLHLLEQTNGRLRRLPQRSAVQQLGVDGERAAYFFLRRQGYVVVARRWRHATLSGEVDLIAWEGESLVFVEVKTREGRSAFAAEFQVDRDKTQALRRMADAYVRQLPWRPGQTPDVHVRFDVASVYMQPGHAPDITLLRDFMR